MSKKHSTTTGTVITSLVVGLVVGAVGTLGYQAYQTTGEDVKQMTEEAAAEEQYGVGGGEIPSEFNEEKSDDEQKETEKQDGEDAEESEEQEKTKPVVDTGQEGEAPFLLPSLTQPTVEEINAESTVYDYGAGNKITVLSGDTAEVARSTTEISSEETFLIDEVEAREVVIYSAKDGSVETRILIEQEDGTLLMISGDEIFIQSVKEDLSF